MNVTACRRQGIKPIENRVNPRDIMSNRADARCTSSTGAARSLRSGSAGQGQWHRPLTGLTAAVKDMYDIAGSRTGAGNPIWLATRSHADASTPRRLPYPPRSMSRARRASAPGAHRAPFLAARRPARLPTLATRRGEFATIPTLSGTFRRRTGGCRRLFWRKAGPAAKGNRRCAPRSRLPTLARASGSCRPRCRGR